MNRQDIGLKSPEEFAVEEQKKLLTTKNNIDELKRICLIGILSKAPHKKDEIIVSINAEVNYSPIDESKHTFKSEFCHENEKTKKLEVIADVVDILALYGWEVENLTDSALTLRPIKNKEVLVSPRHTKERLELLTMEFRAWFNKEMRYYNQGLDSVIAEDITLQQFPDYDYETEGIKIVIKLKDIPTKFLSQNGCDLKTVIEKYIFDNTKYNPEIYGDSKGTAYALELVLRG